MSGGVVACHADTCTFDGSACNPHPSCPDGTRNYGEQCDGSDLGADVTDCSDIGYASGALGCTDLCFYDVSSCVAGTELPCGTVPVGPQQCGDGDSAGCFLLGYSDPNSMSCVACYWDPTSCTNPPAGTCGDGTKGDNEQCDGDDFGFGGDTSCSAYDLGAGQVTCGVDCRVDVSSCSGTVFTPVCGDDNSTHGEQCDGDDSVSVSCFDIGFTGGFVGDLPCNDACRFDTRGCMMCGDGAINFGETCDGTNLGDYAGLDCTDLGFDSGSLACTSCQLDLSGCVGADPCDAVTCETDFVWSCDGQVLVGTAPPVAGPTCLGGVCLYQESRYDCTEGDHPRSCVDGACTATCGDGWLRASEDCDGDNLDETTCADLGFVDGDLGCWMQLTGPTDKPPCTFDVSLCTGGTVSCGDGDVEGDEQCDGSNLGDCTDYGYTGGALACTDCLLDPSACTPEDSCDGNTCATPPEATCDGTFRVTYSGTGACLGGLCGYNDNRFECSLADYGCVDGVCVAVCGDGLLKGDEECDGVAFPDDLTCQDFDCGGGTLSCTDGCTVDISTCTDCAVCGDGVVTGSFTGSASDWGEQCDRDAAGNEVFKPEMDTCEEHPWCFGGGGSVPLGCTTACELDVSVCACGA